MRGGYLHNNVLLARVEVALRERGADVTKERFVTHPGGSGYIDLVAERGIFRIAVEAELSTRRCLHDIVKAEAADADELWIVTPHVRSAMAVRAYLATRVPTDVLRPCVFVFPLGQALQRVTNCFPMFSVSNDPEKRNKQ